METTHTPYRWYHALVGYAALLLGFLGGTLLLTLSTTSGDSPLSGATFNAITLLLIGVLGLLGLRLASRDRVTRSDFGLHTTNWRRTSSVAAVVAVGFFLFTTALEYFIPSLKAASDEVTASLGLGHSLLRDSLLFLSIGLIAPVCEEIIFRGIIFRSLASGLPRLSWCPPRVALVLAFALSAAAFVSHHGTGGQTDQVWGFVLLSLATAGVYYYTKHFHGAVLVHAINNNLVLGLIILQTLPLHTHAVALLLLCISGPWLSVQLTHILGHLLPSRAHSTADS